MGAWLELWQEVFKEDLHRHELRHEDEHKCDDKHNIGVADLCVIRKAVRCSTDSVIIKTAGGMSEKRFRVRKTAGSTYPPGNINAAIEKMTEAAMPYFFESLSFLRSVNDNTA